MFNLSVGMMITAGFIFITLLKIPAPYGRYQGHMKSKYFGFGIPPRIAWVIQELPSFCWPSYFLLMERPHSRYALLLLFLFWIHYFQRTFIFSLGIRSKNQTRLVPFVLAFLFCFFNGYLQSAYLARYFAGSLESSADWAYLLVGCGVFFVGMAINIHSDSLLRNLRSAHDTTIHLPQGGMFHYVSGANFFGEIVEWLGFAIASQFSLPAVAFFLFTFASIAPRGKRHHEQYRQHFANYPRHRRAVIPFIW